MSESTVSRTRSSMRNEQGFSIIEASIIFPLILFLAYGVFCIYLYLSSVNMVIQTAHNATAQISHQAKHLHTGDQGYFLKTSEGCRGKDNKEEIDLLEEIALKAERDIKRHFNCTGKKCPEYFIEARYVSVSVNTSWGSLSIRREGQDSPIIFTKCLQEKNRGLFTVRTNSRSREDYFPLLQYMKKEFNKDTANPLIPSRFSIPAGMLDTNYKQLYGYTEARNIPANSKPGEALNVPIQFLRSSSVIGIWVEVDLASTQASYLSQLSRFWSNTESQTPTLLSSVRLFSPRAIL